MDIRKSRGLYIKRILECIPPHIKPVDYLMELLGISRVSVYRRLKCDLPFNSDEMMILSSTLGFSLDNIVHENNENERPVFSFHIYGDEHPADYFLKILHTLHENLKVQEKSHTRTAMASMNNLWLVYTLGYDHLLKFYYFKWLHQAQSSFEANKLSFHNIVLSDEIIDLSYKIRELVRSTKNTVFIIDQNLFFNSIEDIQYYYRRNLIDKKELELIKSDVETLIDYTRSHVSEGRNSAGEERRFYLSATNIYTNSLYEEFDNHSMSSFYGYCLAPWNTMDNEICTCHKKWMESLKKYAILITASNEAQQMAFFDRQKAYLSSLVNDELLVP